MLLACGPNFAKVVRTTEKSWPDVNAVDDVCSYKQYCLQLCVCSVNEMNLACYLLSFMLNVCTYSVIDITSYHGTVKMN